ncbi:MAG: A/G-specific adenine glycosylase [Candidatus Saccharimonadales bacterium]
MPEADGTFDPYKILVSELMLQQTQVGRVIPKYHEFLAKFPNVRTLAQASLGDVLVVWSGLGYNRRAKFLWQAAQKIQNDFAGTFPNSFEQLVTLPGVGKNTAGAILAYAYNQPIVFIETNIRSVYIHHFFNDQTDISDKAIAEIVELTLPKENAREWYWSLMDYGTHLKQTVGNTARASKGYKKQSAFHGSQRQIRGAVIRCLGQGPKSETALLEQIADDRTPQVLDELVNEQMIARQDDQYKLA